MKKRPVSDPSTPDGFRLPNTGVVATFLVLIGLTLVGIHRERASMVGSAIDQELASLGRTTAETLRLSVENLQSASSILVYFRDIRYEQFKGVTRGYLESDPGLLIIEWQPVVPKGDQEDFVRKARERGLRNFRLWEPDASGKPVPARSREEHVPVLFMLARDAIPMDEGTLGLDLAWSPERMESKWDARDLGRAQASGLFRVVTGPEAGYQPLGFAITLPIYRKGFVPNNQAERRSDLLGYMAGVYSVEDLLEPQIEHLKSAGFNLEVHDQANNGQRLKIAAGSASRYHDAIALDVFGNTLHFRLTATEALVARQFKMLWLVLPTALILFGVMIFVFLHQLQKKNRGLALAQAELETANTTLTELSQRDPLTGVLNRRSFIEELEHELNRMQRHPECIALLLLDLDHFKTVNDKWGHPVGDRVLVAFAESCRRVSRNIDTIGRLGGEEFAILLATTTREDAKHFAQRLQQTIRGLQIPSSENGPAIPITVSIGLNTIEQPMDAAKWIEQTDKALYLAKHSGRDCVKEYLPQAPDSAP